MSSDLIKALIEKLDEKQYVAIMRHLSQNNKQIKIPGFTSLEKVRRPLLINNVTTKKNFRNSFFASYIEVVLDGLAVDVTKSVSENLEVASDDKWLGVVAVFLMTEDERYEEELAKVIEEYSIKNEVANKTAPQKEEKSAKKEDKFREKYLKEHKEKENYKKLLEEKQEECDSFASEIASLKEIIERLTSEKEEICQSFEEINRLLAEKYKEIEQLSAEVKKAQEKHETKTTIASPSRTMSILAPNCKNILSKYIDRVGIDFGDISGKTKEELLEKYDQIWILSSEVTFATNRKLNKWKTDGLDNVIFFSSATSLIEKAEETIR